MKLSQFTSKEINGCACYESGEFLIVQNLEGSWNAYRNGSSIQKIVLRQDQFIDEHGAEQVADVLGAKEYPTPEAAAAACGA